MKFNFNFLAENQPIGLESPDWYWYILLVILFLPWIFLIIYICTMKYRVRIFVNGHLVSTTYLKAGEVIRDRVIVPYQENCLTVLYLDEELTEEFVAEKMPKQNLKLYVKYVDYTSI